MTLNVNPQVYYDAGQKCADLAHQVSKAAGALMQGLSGTGSMAGSYDASKKWATSYDQHADITYNTTRQFASALDHFGGVLAQAGYNHAMANYNADVSSTKGPAPQAPAPAAPPTYGPWAEPPSSGGPGQGLKTDIPGLLQKIGIPVPDGDTDKLGRAADAWSKFAKDGAITNAANAIKAVAATFTDISSPEVRDIDDYLATLQMCAVQVEADATQLSQACADHKSALDQLRKQTHDCLTSLEAQLAVTIAIGILATWVSAGISDEAAVGAGGAEIGETAAAIANAIKGSRLFTLLGKIGQETADGLAQFGSKLQDILGLTREGLEDEEAAAAEKMPDEQLTPEEFKEKYGEPGNWKYPGDEYAVPGTKKIVDLPAGAKIDRYGYPGGGWLSPEDTPLTDRALPPDTLDSKPYFTYEVTDKPLPPGWKIEESEVNAWFGEAGHGTQYKILDQNGNVGSVQELLKVGYLKPTSG